MAKKTIIMSSLGLKNVVMNKYQDNDDFILIFGEQKFRMKNIYAEFISPVISHLHQADPTINTIDFGEINSNKFQEFKELAKSILTQETLSHLIQISSGDSIEINEEQAIKLRFLSIILGNEELHEKLNELFPQNFNEKNVNSYLKNIECCYNFSRFKPDFDFTNLLSFVSSHFYLLNKDDFLKLPLHLQHQIISHPELQIESEDSLFDIIIEIIERNKENEEINDDISFFEQIEFRALSEDRLRSFVDLFDVNEMSVQLWRNLSECLFDHTGTKSKRTIERFRPYILVGGYNEYNQLGENPNNKDEDDHPFISPSLKLSLDPSSLLSYSIYESHAVIITKSGSLLGIGYNSDGQISNSLLETELNQFTEFSIRDDKGIKLVPISVVCTAWGTLYMLSKSDGNGKQLVYFDKDMSDDIPVFLDIGNQEPVALYGGCSNAAAINSEGEIIFINRFSVENLFDSRIDAISLPGGEKASSVACCEDSVVVLSSNGRVFSSSIEKGKNVLKFSVVEELASEEIVCVSGTYKHFVAVSKDGRVFARGSNEHGQLGLVKKTDSVSSFTEILSLRGCGIKAAYAGGGHTLFQTNEGKILSCGSNGYGELLLNSGTMNAKFYSPTETNITGGATFCIVGSVLSIAFVGIEPPSNMPNKRIQ